MRTSLFLSFCLGIALVAGCGEDDTVTRPDDENTLILEGERIDVVYITSLDSVRENYSDTVTADWNGLGWDDAYLMAYYGWMCDEEAIANELLAGDDGTITIIITGCPTGHTWRTLYSDRNDLDLAKRDSVNTTGLTYDISYIFEIHYPGKGYIGFLEKRPPSSGAQKKSFGVMYTCELIDTLRVEADSVTWSYGITELCSEVSVTLKGRTNAHKLFIETYGDGEIGTSEIAVDGEGMFSATYGIAFIYGGDSFLKTNSKLYVIGTVGLPKMIALENPLRASGVSYAP